MKETSSDLEVNTNEWKNFKSKSNKSKDLP